MSAICPTCGTELFTSGECPSCTIDRLEAAGDEYIAAEIRALRKVVDSIRHDPMEPSSETRLALEQLDAEFPIRIGTVGTVKPLDWGKPRDPDPTLPLTTKTLFRQEDLDEQTLWKDAQPEGKLHSNPNDPPTGN